MRRHRSPALALASTVAASLALQFVLLLPHAFAWVPPSHLPNVPSAARIKPSLASIPRSSIRPPRSSPTEDDQAVASMDSMGLNELQTLLREAVAREDYLEAKRCRDVLADRVSSGAYRPTGADPAADRRKMRRLSWRGLGTARWLEDRLDALGYKFPTTIQINALESVNTMLGALDEGGGGGGSKGGGSEEEETPFGGSETLEELIGRKAGPGAAANMGVVVSGSTGSGKTLAYLVPMLSTLSDSLFTRQRIRVKAEEDIGDVADDLLARVAVQTSPTIRGQGRDQVGGSGAIATGAALSTLGKSGTDVRSPLALVVVPTRELGVQTALLMYECVGGSTKQTMTQMPGLANMFKYKGPKGVKIGCILDEEEAKYGLKLQTDVAITTPHFLAKLIRDGDIVPSKLRVVVYDEADLALEQTPDEDLKALFSDTESERSFSRLTYLVGASVTESLGQLEVKEGVLPEGKSFIATATRFAPLSAEDADESAGSDLKGEHATFASLKDLGDCIDPGLRHERVVAPKDRGLLCLARMLRKELQDYEDVVASGGNTTTRVQRPRVVVFFPGEEEAKAAIEPMRDAMWGEHKLCVLLPNIGVNPLDIMEQFKSSKTSVMLATPNSVRGLDFANLTHVYTLYLPADDPREYVHLAGRVGRIGQVGSVSGGGGRVTSILQPKESEKMEDLAQELNFDFIDVDYQVAGVDRGEDGETDLDNSDVEQLRRYLEDTISLVDLADDADVDLGAPRTRTFEGSEDDDDEDDDGEE